MLYHDVLAALRAEGADGVLARETIREYRIIVADADFVGAGLVPAVENPTHEIAQLLRRYREIRNAAGHGVPLDTWYELQVPGAEAGAEVEQFIGVVGVEVIDEDEDVVFDVVFFAAVNGPHHFVESSGAGMVGAVVVVVLFWAVDTDADEEVIFAKELAPLVVEEDGVGLQSIADDLAGYAVFPLQLDELLIEIEAHERGFTTLPCKTRLGKLQLEVIGDEAFEYFVAHTLAALADFGCTAFVEAVFAIEIAVGTGWFY